MPNSSAQTSGNGLSLVEEVENVSGFLVVDLENWPEGLAFSLALVRIGLCLSHLLFQLL